MEVVHKLWEGISGSQETAGFSKGPHSLQSGSTNQVSSRLFGIWSGSCDIPQNARWNWKTYCLRIMHTESEEELCSAGKRSLSFGTRCKEVPSLYLWLETYSTDGSPTLNNHFWPKEGHTITSSCLIAALGFVAHSVWLQHWIQTVLLYLLSYRFHYILVIRSLNKNTPIFSCKRKVVVAR